MWEVKTIISSEIKPFTAQTCSCGKVVCPSAVSVTQKSVKHQRILVMRPFIKISGEGIVQGKIDLCLLLYQWKININIFIRKLNYACWFWVSILLTIILFHTLCKLLAVALHHPMPLMHMLAAVLYQPNL